MYSLFLTTSNFPRGTKFKCENKKEQIVLFFMNNVNNND